MRIAVAGATGRMGKMLIQAVLAHPDLTLAAALVPSGNVHIGQDAGAFLGQHTGILLSDNLAQLSQVDCLIDFTRPEGTLAHLPICCQYGVRMVIGTTGFDESGQQAIAQAAERIAIVQAANMSVGVNAMLPLLQLATQLLKGADIEIVEAHHRHKVDAPSGTAIMLGQAVAQTLGQPLEDLATWSRHGHTGPREDNRIGFSVLRGGDIIGEHTVLFCGQGERIEISHKASGRHIYAQGSCQAVLFLRDKSHGLFDMQAVIKGTT